LTLARTMPKKVNYTLKLSLSTRGVDTINAVYAFVMALGLTEVFIGSHTFITSILFGGIASVGPLRPLSFLFFINVVLLGMRFFWVPRNLVRIFYVSALLDPEAPGLSRLPNWFISLNWLVIFMHAGLYYVICREFKYIMFLLSSNASLDATSFSGYFLGHAALLVLNGLWIGMLAKYEERVLSPSRDNGTWHDIPGGVIWSRNNLACSLLALGPYVTLGTCQSGSFACLAALNLSGEGAAALVPISPMLITVMYDMGAAALGGFGLDRALSVSLWVMACFLLNSCLDLLTTGQYYVVLEEIEWEGRLSSGNKGALEDAE